MRKLKLLLLGAAAIAVLAATSLPAKGGDLGDISKAGIIFLMIDEPPAVVNISGVAFGSSATANTTYTFTSQSFGAAAADRGMVLCITGEDGTATFNVASCSVGGVACKRLNRIDEAQSSGITVAEIWTVPLPTGTSGTVSITFSEAVTHCGFALYRLVGATLEPYQGSVSWGAQPESVTFECPSDGGFVAISCVDSSAFTFTWTNATEYCDTSPSGHSFSSAYENVSSGGSKTVTATLVGGSSQSMNIVAASFGNITGYPYVSSKSQGTTTASTSHTVTLPAGIVAGDKLIVSMAQSGANSANWSFPAGWTEITDAGGGSNSSLGIAWRNADGSEGASITVTSATNAVTAYGVYCMKNCHTDAPEAGTAAVNGTVTTSDPPSVTASWGAGLNVAIAVSSRRTDNKCWNWPQGFGHHQMYPFLTNQGLAMCISKTTSATSDPGVFTFATANNATAQTIMVRAA